MVRFNIEGYGRIDLLTLTVSPVKVDNDCVLEEMKISLDSVKQRLSEYKSKVDEMEMNLKENDSKLMVKEIQSMRTKYVTYLKQRDRIEEVVNSIIDSRNKLEEKGISTI